MTVLKENHYMESYKSNQKLLETLRAIYTFKII